MTAIAANLLSRCKIADNLSVSGATGSRDDDDSDQVRLDEEYKNPKDTLRIG